MNTNIIFLIWLGIFNLSIMTYQDIKTMKVDSRANFFMSGIAIALLIMNRNTMPGLYPLILVVISIMFYFFPLGIGDKRALSWIVLLLGSITPAALIAFLVVYAFMLLINLFSIILTKPNKKIPGMPFIFSAYIIAAVFILPSLF